MMRGNRGWIGGAYQQGVMESALESLGYETSGSRLRKLEAELEALRERGAPLAEIATVKLNRGQPLSPEEAAEILSSDKKLLQRMRAKGAITPCIARGSFVRYSASDILRLASAPRRER